MLYLESASTLKREQLGPLCALTIDTTSKQITIRIVGTEMSAFGTEQF
jgi:hypothetical protein